MKRKHPKKTVGWVPEWSVNYVLGDRKKKEGATMWNRSRVEWKDAARMRWIAREKPSMGPGYAMKTFVCGGEEKKTVRQAIDSAMKSERKGAR